MDSQPLPLYSIRSLIVDGKGCSLGTNFKGNPNALVEIRVGERPFDIQDRHRAVRVHPAHEMQTPGVQRQFSWWLGKVRWEHSWAGLAVLEIACGTGRVTMRLAQDGVGIVGLDLSPAMLSVAREKSIGMSNIRWVQGDMRLFELGETFGLAIIPGHSFQNLLTAEDQVASLKSIKRHLVPGGILVVHLDHLSVSWLGELTGDQGGVFKTAGSFSHPMTGKQIRTSQAWSYEPATQTAISQTVWEEINVAGEVIDHWESGSLRFHCVFRFEMDHLLERTGFAVEAVYGDFFRQELCDESSEMIWVARKR